MREHGTSSEEEELQGERATLRWDSRGRREVLKEISSSPAESLNVKLDVLCKQREEREEHEENLAPSSIFCKFNCKSVDLRPQT